MLLEFPPETNWYLPAHIVRTLLPRVVDWLAGSRHHGRWKKKEHWKSSQTYVIYAGVIRTFGLGLTSRVIGCDFMIEEVLKGGGGGGWV